MKTKTKTPEEKQATMTVPAFGSKRVGTLLEWAKAPHHEFCPELDSLKELLQTLLPFCPVAVEGRQKLIAKINRKLIEKNRTHAIIYDTVHEAKERKLSWDGITELVFEEYGLKIDKKTLMARYTNWKSRQKAKASKTNIKKQ